MGGRGSSMRGSQGMGGGTGAPAAAAQAMPTVRAAPAVQQAGPPTGATGFGHLTPQQVAAFENAAQQQMQRDRRWQQASWTTSTRSCRATARP